MAYSVQEFRRRFQTYVDSSIRDEEQVVARLSFSPNPRPVAANHSVSTPDYHEPPSSDVSWDTHWDTISNASSAPAQDRPIQLLTPQMTIPPPPGFATLHNASTPNMELIQFMQEATLLGVTPGAEMQKYVAEQQARKERIEIARITTAKSQNQTLRQGLTAPKLHLRVWDPKEEDLDSFLHRFERIMREYEVSDTQKLSHFSSLLTGEALKIFTRMDADSDLSYAALTRELRHCFSHSESEYQKLFQETLIHDDETSNQYLGRLSENFRRMFEKAYPGKSVTTDSLINHILRMQFLKGLDRGCRFKLAENGINEVEEMAKFVDKWRNAKKEMKEENANEDKKKKDYRKYSNEVRLSAAIGNAETESKVEKERNSADIKKEGKRKTSKSSFPRRYQPK